MSSFSPLATALQYSRALIKNIALQIVSLLVLLSLVSIGYAAYMSLTVGEVATWQPVTQSLMTKIKDNLDDLNSRVNKHAFSNTVITTTLWAQVLTNTCYSSPATLSVITPGMYNIQISASSYLYTGTYSNLWVQFVTSWWSTLCIARASLSQGSVNWYMFPSWSCIEHLDSGTYTFYIGWSDSNLCATSSIDKIFGGTAAIRLLQAD